MAISKDDIRKALDNWGKGLVSISKTYQEGGDYIGTAKSFISAAYAFDEGPVLFKPTLASQIMFRTTFDGALSYFVGGNDRFIEDQGFAIRPWVEVNFDLAGFLPSNDIGLVMGNKLLLSDTGQITKANFSMGFRKSNGKDVKIVFHHSSLPFQQ